MLALIKVPFCQAYKHTNTTGRMEKPKSVSRTHEPSRAQKSAAVAFQYGYRTNIYILAKILFYVKTILTLTINL